VVELSGPPQTRQRKILIWQMSFGSDSS